MKSKNGFGIAVKRSLSMTASPMMTMWNHRGGGESDDLDVRVPPQVSLFAPQTRPSRGSAG
eukprot:12063250-Heterocapsa_arctica.AAC.1